METEIAIIIKSKEDQTPAISSRNYIHTTLKSFVILEQATSNNKTGVVLHTKLKDGKDVFINTTATIFKGMADALAGAEIRFKEGLTTEPNKPLIEVLNGLLQMNKHQIDLDDISDGKNTFGDLYKLLQKASHYNLDFDLHKEIEQVLNK